MRPKRFSSALRTIASAVLFSLSLDSRAEGIAAGYPNDIGIEKDSRVLFADNFESGELKKWDEKRATIAITREKPNSGKYCVHIPMHRGKDNGGDAIKWSLAPLALNFCLLLVLGLTLPRPFIEALEQALKILGV